VSTAGESTTTTFGTEVTESITSDISFTTLMVTSTTTSNARWFSNNEVIWATTQVTILSTAQFLISPGTRTTRHTKRAAEDSSTRSSSTPDVESNVFGSLWSSPIVTSVPALSSTYSVVTTTKLLPLNIVRTMVIVGTCARSSTDNIFELF
jgi:hypothetical protein